MKTTSAGDLHQRATVDQLREQFANLARRELLLRILDYLPNVILVLNEQRQAVYVNRQLLKTLDLKGLPLALGRRPGELLRCRNASLTKGGCGTSDFCRYCGAFHAILGALGGSEEVRECRICTVDGDSLDFRVWSTPISLPPQSFVLLAMMDIRDEKRREALERVFFHDIMNTVGALQGTAQLLKVAPAEKRETLEKTLLRISNHLTEELQAQRDLTAAEAGDLTLYPGTVGTRALMQEVAETYTRMEANPVEVAVSAEAQALSMVTDRRLLARVLTNLVKNAVEASSPGERVSLNCAEDDGKVVFTVHNPGVMKPEVRAQVFQHAFSTKGPGRGLGTYSVKLLTERYLEGEVGFVSTEAAGTTFHVALPVTHPLESD